MPAPKRFTWDFDLLNNITAYAADLVALGEARLIDHAQRPPKPPTMPYAAMLNQWALQLAGVNRVVTALDLEIHFTAGTPAVFNAAAMSSIIDTPWAQTNIQVVHVATGDVLIIWPAGTLPPPRMKPRAFVVADGQWLQPTVILSGNTVEVKTYDNNANLTDVDFCVTIF